MHDSVSGLIQLLDINTNNERLAAQPVIMNAFEDKLHFSGDDGIHGSELWIHSPATGALMVADINANGSGLPAPEESLIEPDGKLYFPGFGGTDPEGLWVYDSASRASVVGRVDNEPYAGYIRELTELDDQFYFWALREVKDWALWQYNPVSFSVTNADSGTTLWVYDPQNPLSAAMMVADIWPGPDDGSPCEFHVMDGKIYFRSNTGGANAELWEHDPACS